jgi:hypothetical protein
VIAGCGNKALVEIPTFAYVCHAHFGEEGLFEEETALFAAGSREICSRKGSFCSPPEFAAEKVPFAAEKVPNAGLTV